MERGNYMGLKQTDQILKVIEGVIENLIKKVDWDAVWFHGRMWNYKCHFHGEPVTGEILSKKRGFRTSYL